MVSLVEAARDVGKLEGCCLLLGVSRADGVDDEGSGSDESGDKAEWKRRLTMDAACDDKEEDVVNVVL
jgi:hypothetical protein